MTPTDLLVYLVLGLLLLAVLGWIADRIEQRRPETNRRDAFNRNR